MKTKKIKKRASHHTMTPVLGTMSAIPTNACVNHKENIYNKYRERKGQRIFVALFDDSSLSSNKDTNSFLCKQGLNVRSLIQPSEILVILMHLLASP